MDITFLDIKCSATRRDIEEVRHFEVDSLEIISHSGGAFENIFI